MLEIKREFGGRDKELVKVAELKKIEQGGRTMEEFIQDFKRVARGSRYKRHPLIEEFKQDINVMIRKKLMEAENQSDSIEQWFRRATALDRNWRESRKEEERIKGIVEKKTPTLWQQYALINRESKIQVWPRRQRIQQ